MIFEKNPVVQHGPSWEQWHPNAEPSDVNDFLHRLVTEELEIVCLIVLIVSLSAGSVVWDWVVLSLGEQEEAQRWRMRCVVSGTSVCLSVLVLSIVDLVRNVSVRAWAVCAKLIFCSFRCCKVRTSWQVGRRKNSLGRRL